VFNTIKNPETLFIVLFHMISQSLVACFLIV